MKRIVLLMILLLTSCTAFKKPPTILEDSSCEAPCWNGIKMGETTQDEATGILRNLANVDQNMYDVRAWNNYDGGLRFYLYPSGFYRHAIEVELQFIDKKAADIIFCGHLEMTFGDIVNKIGEPKHIIIIASPSGLFVAALNEDNGTEFIYNTAEIPRRLHPGVAPETPIKCLMYFDPAFYDEMLESGTLSEGAFNAEETLKVMYPWAGYGNIEEKYPYRNP